MSTHLWELSDVYHIAGEAAREEHFHSWKAFLESKIWKNDWIYECKPVHWNWCDVTNPEFDGYDDEDFLDLVWLHLWPCNAYVVHIYLKKEDEPEARSWLLKHKFLPEER